LDGVLQDRSAMITMEIAAITINAMTAILEEEQAT
jgi:hypothetical protein